MSPLVLLVFVAPADAGSPATLSLVAAAAAVLRDTDRVELRVWTTPPTHEEMLAAGRSAGATAVARVRWRDADRLEALVLATLVAGGETIQRTVRFRPRDELPERGRALGFIIGSFAAERGQSTANPGESTGSETPPTAGPTPAPVASPPAVVASASSAGTPPPPPPAAVVSPLPSPIAPPATPSRGWAIEAFGLGGVAIGGVAHGWGAGVGLRWPQGSTWGGRLAARARTGSVPAAQASSMAAALSLGGVRTLAAGGGPRPGVNLRLDALLLYDELTHFSSDDPEPVRRARLLPGAAAAGEAAWSLSPSITAFLAVGVEAAAGRTTVYVRGEPVATVAPLRLLLEAGFRARF